jgi:pimeloyl-ACP methyl ester carboxylesterase
MSQQAKASVTRGLAVFPPLRKIRLPHGELSYREKGTGRPLVFFHGMNGDSRSWSRQYENLSDSFRVIAWDAPGYGESGLCECSADAFADAGLALLRELGVEGATLVGHSMGGIVAARLVSRMTAARTAVARLVLSCSHWGYCEGPGAPLHQRYAKRIEEMRVMDRTEYGKIRAIAMVPPSSSKELLDFLAAISMDARPEGIANAGRMVQEADNRELLGRLGLPVMVLYSEDDRVAPLETSKQLLAMVPGARATMLKGVGHAPYAEDPASYDRALLEFIGS